VKFLNLVAKACAALAGVILTAITLITCVSLLGRNTIGKTLVGDYELTAFVAGAAVALFMPLCQLQRQHIIVDFFTAKASPATNLWLDRLGALCMAALMFVLAWRTTVGGISSFRSASSTMMLGLPEWWAYAAMVPPLFIAGVIALVQACSAKAISWRSA
jgi:TRAP-type C4-dicarboxylate transport system permease small subunit